MSAHKPVFNISDWIKTQHCYDIGKKPIEIYVFVDPLCPECWGLEPIIRKLQIEYGQLFSLRHVLSGKIDSLNMGKNKNYENLAQVWKRQPADRECPVTEASGPKTQSLLHILLPSP